MSDELAMTQAAYAAHRGVSRQAISKLVGGGKIPVRPDGKIDAAEADRALGETRERLDEPRESGGFMPSQESAGLTKARTATEVYKARVAQLDYEERIGKLRPIDDIRDAAQTVAGALMRVIELLPAMADDLTAAAMRGGPEATRAALKVKRDEMLRDLVAAMDELAAVKTGQARAA